VPLRRKECSSGTSAKHCAAGRYVEQPIADDSAPRNSGSGGKPV
jgi:hypothetical protein